MKQLILFIMLIFNALTLNAAKVISVIDTAINECIEITNKSNEFGEFGSKSRGLSLGTHVSYILFSLQELNIINYANINYDKNKSIYQVCSTALQEFGYKQKEHIFAIEEGYSEKEIIDYLKQKNNFIKILSSKVKEINKSNGLVVFVAWGKNGRPQ